jgi:hypothetical protein
MIYRHKKRGTTYEIVGRAKMQISPDSLPVDEGYVASWLEDTMTMVVYRSTHDGTLWIRPESEFFERFEAVPIVLMCYEMANGKMLEVSRIGEDYTLKMGGTVMWNGQA